MGGGMHPMNRMMHQGGNFHGGGNMRGNGGYQN